MRRTQNDSEYLRPPEEFPVPAAQMTPPPPEFGGDGKDASVKKKKRRYHWLAAALAAGLLSTVTMFSDIEEAILAPLVSPTPIFMEAAVTTTPTPSIAPTPAPTAEPTATPKPTLEPKTIPAAKLTFYRTSEVYHGAVILEAEDKMTAVTVRIWDRALEETMWEYSLTVNDIARGWYQLPDFDLGASEFAKEHWDQLMAGYEPDPLLEVICTARTDDGEQTFTERAEAADELWISVRYDLKDPEEDFLHYFMGETTYPDCFVLRIDPSPFGELNVIYGESAALRPGDVAVTLTVDGQPIPADTCRLEITSRTRGDQTLYAYAFVMPRPASFPDHGTADVRITRKLLSFDMIVANTSTLTY